MKQFLKFLVFLGLLASCEGDEEMVFARGGEYFALQTGVFQLYEVSEIHYEVSGQPVHLDYELRTEVVDSFPSGEERYTYVIHRSKRSSEAEQWQHLDTWSARQEKGEVVVSEGSTSYVKIKFPLTPDNAWNGNILNSEAADEYGYTDIASPFELNGLTFQNTITIEQEDNEDSIVFRDERKEIYALNVGLIYKEVIQLNYCTADACLGQQKIDHGIEIKMTIKDYGKQ